MTLISCPIRFLYLTIQIIDQESRRRLGTNIFTFDNKVKMNLSRAVAVIFACITQHPSTNALVRNTYTPSSNISMLALYNLVPCLHIV